MQIQDHDHLSQLDHCRTPPANREEHWQLAAAGHPGRAPDARRHANWGIFKRRFRGGSLRHQQLPGVARPSTPTAPTISSTSSTPSSSTSSGRLRCVRPKRSEEPTSELQSLMRISYAVFCLKKKKTKH